MHNEDISVFHRSPDFIAQQHTGEFFDILPETSMIKGAKNEKGFDQGYAIRHVNTEDYILIDVVGAATKDAVAQMVKDDKNILAILITGHSVLKDAFGDLEELSENAGGAQIYVHPRNETDGSTETCDISVKDSLMADFGITVIDLPADKDGAVLLYANRNEGMLFVGDSAQGSDYSGDNFRFTREKLEKTEDEFKMGDSWSSLNKDFKYMFPRKGKPAININAGERTDILNRLSKRP